MKTKELIQIWLDPAEAAGGGKGRPRQPQDHPKTPQDASRPPHGRRKTLKDRPKGLQMSPRCRRTAQRGSSKESPRPAHAHVAHESF